MQRGKPAKKYSQASRVHDIIRLIESRHGMTIEELAEETGVTRRTIHRDLNVVHEAGYPLVSEWENNSKVYRFLTRFKDVPPISFTLQELATLYFLRGQAEVFQGTPFDGEIGSIYRKIRSVLPPRYAAHLERISGCALPLLQGRHDYSSHAELLGQLRDALIHQQRLSIRYTPPGRQRPTAYLVDPYTLIFYKGGLYLLAYAHNRKALRTFAVERIGSVRLEQERFELPPDYSPEERLKGAFGIVAEPVMEVSARFSSQVAHAVRGRLWHPSQRITDGDDGSVVLTFSAGGKMEIIAWLLSYGEHVEVLAPTGLRQEVEGIVARMKKVYGG